MSSESDEVRKTRYPPAVFFMLGNEFCERFSFYGMKAILTLYFIIEHHMQPSTATLIYHAFTCVAYLCPLLGSILADSYLGRFKVILYGSIIYVVGHALLSFGAIPTFEYTTRTIFDFSGLAVIAFATGGIKPCVSAFAADQFSEDQHHFREQFFSLFYFSINAGSLFATLLTPILRSRVSCMGSQYCFPLAFGVPGVLMFIALIFFLCGWNLYKKHPPSRENVAGTVVGCISTAAKRTLMRSSAMPVAHWLDRAAPDYSSDIIKGVKSFVAVAIIFGPLVFFWALFDQQGSTWVLQARRLDGRIGKLTILAEQVNVLNPALILIMVPLFEWLIYPCMKKIVHVTPLRKMAVGGLLAGLAFVMAGIVQIKVNETLEVSPSSGNVFLQRIGNASNVHGFKLDNGENINGGLLSAGRTEVPSGMYSISGGHEQHRLNLSIPNKGYVVGLYDAPDGKSQLHSFMYTTEKTENGASRIYLMVPAANNGHIHLVDNDGELISSTELKTGLYVDILPPIISSPNYKLYFGRPNCTGKDCPNHIDFKVEMGSVSVLHIQDSMENDLTLLVRPNTVSILWVIPQYVIITLGEVLLSVTALEFAYSQSAPNMKSVLQALWLLTVFLGNAIDMGISGSHIIAEPATELFFYAFLMFLVMGVFILLAMRYHYVDEDEQDEQEDEKSSSSKEEKSHPMSTEEDTSS